MKSTLSTSTVARMLGVAVRSVSNWIDAGKLKAGRTPGGHRRVESHELVAFLDRQKLPIPPELTHKPPRVLVVDDEPSFAKWVVDEIHDLYPQCEVLVAHDGFAAGEIVATSKPDVVILDLKMPKMDGFEVCRRIKARTESQSTVVIAVTAYPSDEAEKRILQCGAQAYFPKPVDRDAMMSELAAVLS